jgi:hypothetical protein
MSMCVPFHLTNSKSLVRPLTANASVVAEVRKLTDKPILIMYDAIASAEIQQAGIDVLVAGGKLVTALPPSVKAEDKDHLCCGVGVASSRAFNSKDVWIFGARPSQSMSTPSVILGQRLAHKFLSLSPAIVAAL